jgi:hypothetical protein
MIHVYKYEQRPKKLDIVIKQAEIKQHSDTCSCILLNGGKIN